MNYFKRLIRTSVLTLEEYAPGPTPAIPGAAKLSANENGFGMAPAVREAIERALSEPPGSLKALSRYPDLSCSALREALSRKHGLPADWFLVGNGLDDVINLFALAVLDPEDEAVAPAMTFQVYAGATEMMGARLVAVPMRDDLSIDTEAVAEAVTNRTAMVFLCNPNNPTGTTASREEFDALLRYLDSLPTQPLLIVDQAYADFVEEGVDFPEATRYLEGRRYIVVLHTFSKACGMAGLRVGYAIAHPDLLSYLYRVRQPYTVNALAQAAALAAVEDESALDFEKSARAETLKGRAKLEAFLGERKIPFVPSQGNFVFAFHGRSPKELLALSKKLAEEKILVRTLSHDDAPSGLRFSIGTPEENERLIAALDRVLPD